MGVDAGTGYIHTVTVTATNVHDITEAHNLLRKDDNFVSGDSGYFGIKNREKIIRGEQKPKKEYRITQRPSKIRKIPEGYARAFERNNERRKSALRSKVEHIFLLIKREFNYKKTEYKGIAKNLNRLMILSCSVNLLMCARSGDWRTS